MISAKYVEMSEANARKRAEPRPPADPAMLAWIEEQPPAARAVLRVFHPLDRLRCKDNDEAPLLWVIGCTAVGDDGSCMLVVSPIHPEADYEASVRESFVLEWWRVGMEQPR